MAMRYVQVYHDFIHSLTPLSDAERGRLFTAMLEYAGQGTAPDLRGNERFVWPQLKSQIDRDCKRYDGISQVRSEAGKQGGLAKAGKRKQKKQKPASAGKCTQDKDKEEDKDNNKDDDEDKDRVREGGCGSETPLLSDEEAQKYAADLEAVFAHAKLIGIPDTYSDRIRSDTLVSEYSADWLTEAIKRAGDGPQSARSWRYIEGILRSWRKNGGIDSGRSPDKPKGKTVIEQQYNQRDYSDQETGLTPEEIAEALQYDA